jgi:hypothetical protein
VVSLGGMENFIFSIYVFATSEMEPNR